MNELDQYINNKLITHYGDITITLEAFKEKENYWIHDPFIKKESFSILKEDWDHVFEKKEERTSKNGKKFKAYLTDDTRKELCKGIYDSYKISDTKTFDFDKLYILYLVDESSREDKNNPLINFYRSESDSYLQEKLIELQYKELYRFSTLVDNIKLNEKYKASPDTTFTYCNTVTQLEEELPFTNPIDLWYHFNAATLNDIIPFCTYKNFYKCKENIKMLPEWIELELEKKIDSDHIIFYVKYEDEYQKVYMKSTSIIVQIKFDKDITPDIILKHISDTFAIPEKITSTPKNQKSIKAVCYMKVPKPIDNLKLLLFHIHTYENYSNFIFAEESRVVMTDRQYLFLTYYTNPAEENEYVSFNISNVDKSDNSKINCYEKEESYIQLNIRHCPTQLLIQNTVSFLTTLLTTYNSNVDEIKKIFKKAKIPLPIMVTKITKEKRENTKSTVEEGTHTRGQQFRPNIYPLSSLEQYSAKYYIFNTPDPNNALKTVKQPQGMLFPKKIEDEQKDQKLYVCDRDKDYYYIDVKEFQNSDNKNILVPTCKLVNNFESDPNYKKSNLYKYITGYEEEEKKVVQNTYFKIKGQILNPNQYGSSFSWINRWFLLHNPTKKIYRMGISSKANHSILYLLETVKQYNKSVKNKGNILDHQFITKKHHELCQLWRIAPPYDILTEARQISKDCTMDTLFTQFENGYIDPRMYYSFLSRVYQMEIILFEKRDYKSSDFYLSHPPYKYNYQRYNIYPTVVGVVLHQGSEFDRRDHPMCELLITTDILDDVTKTITEKSYTLNESKEYIIASLRELYNLSIVTCNIYQYPIQSQVVNSYGMTTCVTILYNGTEYPILLVEPIHSLPVKTITTIHVWSKDDVNAIIKLHDIHNEIKSYGIYRGYQFIYNHITYFLPISSNEETNTMETYITYEKRARYFKEYTCYLFSKFIHNYQSKIQLQSLYEISLQNHLSEDETEELKGLLDNVKKELEELDINEDLNSSTIYGYIDKFCSTIHNDGTFVIPIDRTIQNIEFKFHNDIVRKKLVYMLLLEYKTNKDELLSYYKSKTLHNYYIYPYDFDTKENHQIMIKNSFVTYVEHQEDGIAKGHTEFFPNFIKRSVVTIQKNPYVLYKKFHECQHITSWLIQPVSSLNQACFLTQKWNERNTNATLEWLQRLTTGQETDDTDTSSEQYDQCNIFKWTSNDTYTFKRSSTPTKLVPYLLIFSTKPNHAFIQVMLPM